MCRLGMPVGYATILRHVKRNALSQIDPAVIRVAGVDDWAWRKGTTYGTIIVDLERRQVVDLLPDRSAVSTANWLKAHPEIEIVSRDRAGLYAEGAREGAPQARQVADRFHLLQNFREAVERQLGQFGAPTREAPTMEARPVSAIRAATDEPAPGQSASQGLARRRKCSDALEYQNAARLARRANRQALFDKIRELYNAGKTVSAIARDVGFGRKSVDRWVRLLVLPARNSMMPKTQSTPAYHEAFLLRRWVEGMTNGRRLFAEILQRGYAGSYSHVARLLAPWREVAVFPKVKQSGPLAGFHSPNILAPVLAPSPAPSPTLDPTTSRKISALTAAALCVKPRGQMTPQQIASVDALKIESAEFAVMRQLAMRFRGLLMGSSMEKLDVWLQDARLSGVYGMQRFARAARQDFDAVRNAILEPWSSGQTEGQINRLKILKRAMYGRAGVELLRARMIPL
jgi:hypothetical protein